MADLSVTAANVALKAQLQPRTVQAGETVTAGQYLYYKSDGKYWKAQCDGTAEEAGSAGLVLALTGGAANDYIVAIGGGAVNPGATLTGGTIYILSTTLGGIAPFADYAGYATGARLIVLGAATTTSTLALQPWTPGYTK